MSCKAHSHYALDATGIAQAAGWALLHATQVPLHPRHTRTVASTSRAHASTREGAPDADEAGQAAVGPLLDADVDERVLAKHALRVQVGG